MEEDKFINHRHPEKGVARRRIGWLLAKQVSKQQPSILPTSRDQSDAPFDYQACLPERQGKRPDQVVSSYKLFFWSLVATVILITLISIFQ